MGPQVSFPPVWAQASLVAWVAGEAGPGGCSYGVVFVHLYLRSSPCTKEAFGNIFCLDPGTSSFHLAWFPDRNHLFKTRTKL